MTRATTGLFLALLSALALGCPGRDGPPPESPAEPSLHLPGLAAFTAEMLRRGAGERSTEQIAEQIEEVGGDLNIETDADSSTIEVRVLREHVGLALELIADMAQRPTFPGDEVERVRARELDRLALMQSNPRWLVKRAFYQHLYGPDHPYGQVDADPEAIRALTRDHLIAFHRENYVPRNAFLVAAGDIDADTLAQVAEQRFGAWEDRPAPAHEIPTLPERSEREVLVVHVPGTTQAQISVGNVAIPRSHPDYLRFRVANQVLGGSASARLFMNLRERCSYSYGIYSMIPSRLAAAPITVGGAVESQHTAGALREIFGELDRIVTDPPPADELDAAQEYLVGHFPIITETAGNLAELVALQRVLGLPDDYWSTYRSSVSAVTAEEALAAARAHLHPDRALVVIVGDETLVAEPARRWGPVTVVGVDGQVIRHLDAAPGQWPGGEPDRCPEPRAQQVSRPEQPPPPAIPRDLDFPEVHERTLANGLQVLTIERRQLPLVYLRFVVRSGSAADPL